MSIKHSYKQSESLTSEGNIIKDCYVYIILSQLDIFSLIRYLNIFTTCKFLIKVFYKDHPFNRYIAIVSPQIALEYMNIDKTIEPLPENVLMDKVAKPYIYGDKITTETKTYLQMAFENQKFINSIEMLGFQTTKIEPLDFKNIHSGRTIHIPLNNVQIRDIYIENFINRSLECFVNCNIIDKNSWSARIVPNFKQFGTVKSCIIDFNNNVPTNIVNFICYIFSIIQWPEWMLNFSFEDINNLSSAPIFECLWESNSKVNSKLNFNTRVYKIQTNLSCPFVSKILEKYQSDFFVKDVGPYMLASITETAYKSLIKSNEAKYLSLEPYLIDKNLPNARTLSIPIPQEIINNSSDVEIEYTINLMLKNIVKYGILKQDSWSIKIPLKSIEKSMVKDYCFINFNDTVELETIALVKTIIDKTYWPIALTGSKFEHSNLTKYITDCSEVKEGVPLLTNLFKLESETVQNNIGIDIDINEYRSEYVPVFQISSNELISYIRKIMRRYGESKIFYARLPLNIFSDPGYDITMVGLFVNDSFDKLVKNSKDQELVFYEGKHLVYKVKVFNFIDFHLSRNISRTIHIILDTYLCDYNIETFINKKLEEYVKFRILNGKCWRIRFPQFGIIHKECLIDFDESVSLKRVSAVRFLLYNEDVQINFEEIKYSESIKIEPQKILELNGQVRLDKINLDLNFEDNITKLSNLLSELNLSSNFPVYTVNKDIEYSEIEQMIEDTTKSNYKLIPPYRYKNEVLGVTIERKTLLFINEEDFKILNRLLRLEPFKINENDLPFDKNYRSLFVSVDSYDSCNYFIENIKSRLNILVDWKIINSYSIRSENYNCECFIDFEDKIPLSAISLARTILFQDGLFSIRYCLKSQKKIPFLVFNIHTSLSAKRLDMILSRFGNFKLFFESESKSIGNFIGLFNDLIYNKLTYLKDLKVEQSIIDDLPNFNIAGLYIPIESIKGKKLELFNFINKILKTLYYFEVVQNNSWIIRFKENNIIILFKNIAIERVIMVRKIINNIKWSEYNKNILTKVECHLLKD